MALRNKKHSALNRRISKIMPVHWWSIVSTRPKIHQVRKAAPANRDLGDHKIREMFRYIGVNPSLNKVK